MNVSLAPVVSPHPVVVQRIATPRSSVWLAMAVLLVLCVSNGPLFVCMPLTNDTAMYDLQARAVLDGGAPYRDILEPNLPGVLWIHVLVRSVFGSSSEAMRAFDLVAFAGIIGLLTRWQARTGSSAAVQAWTAFALLLLYLSVSEWCHCQRDVWLLIPALTGLHLRARQSERLTIAPALGPCLVWAFAEGLVWGSAVWIKPMVVLPMLAVWLMSLAQVRRWRWLSVDFLGLLAGGSLVGIAGIAWLMHVGAWPAFWETLREWNPQYFAAGKKHWTGLRFAAMVYRMSPWIFLHLAAAPVAVLVFVNWLRRAIRADGEPLDFARSVLAVFYLAWLAQSFFLQHLFDYVHLPGILLAVAFLASLQPPVMQPRKWRLATIGFLFVAVLASPALRSDRLAVWLRCWTEGSTPELRNRLAQTPYPDWQALDRTADYLRGLNLKDGELTCYNNDLVYLYNDLDLQPSTRYVYLEALLIFFPERRREIHTALAKSKQRYLVSDMNALGLRREEMQEGRQGTEPTLPASFPEQAKRLFPWKHPVAFRAGSILVHRIPDAER